jgi:ketosteroid isomerase-like protein
MSKENVEVVRRNFAAFDRGDLDGILVDLHPHVVSRAHPIGEEYKGHGGFRRFIANWTEQFEDFQQTAEEFTDAGDQVLVRVLQRARGRGSGVPVEAHFWIVHLVEGGKVTRVELFDDEARALEAAGLSE